MLKKLQGDDRTLESLIWSKWLDGAARLGARYSRALDDDPFTYNETATVSLLCSAGSLIGGVALAEYALTKRAQEDRRKTAPGRCDLFLRTEGRSWAFEFKQLYPWGVPRKRLETAWNSAQGCARCLPRDEADRRVAGLVVSLHYTKPEREKQTVGFLREFAHVTDYAWELSSKSKNLASTFFFFKVC